MTARDGNGDGLLEWGSNEFTPPNPQWQAYTLQAARYESGLDNSPMYDDAEFDAPTATMRLADVGLNAAYSMDAWALARLAEAIGDTENAKKLSDEHAAMKRRFNELLWSEEDGIYLNRYWNGDFSKRLAPTLFYTLGGRVAEPERAKRMVEEHMLNEDEFWGDHVLPAISRNDPAFGDQEYWRGRIWGPMNWLAYEGLRHYGLEQVAREMGEKNLRTFLAEWEGESHVHENYNGATGEGDDAKYSEPVYFWGGLLALIGLIESGALKWDEA
jgi:neutral trehalase